MYTNELRLIIWHTKIPIFFVFVIFYHFCINRNTRNAITIREVTIKKSLAGIVVFAISRKSYPNRIQYRIRLILGSCVPVFILSVHKMFHFPNGHGGMFDSVSCTPTRSCSVWYWISGVIYFSPTTPTTSPARVSFVSRSNKWILMNFRLFLIPLISCFVEFSVFFPFLFETRNDEFTAIGDTRLYRITIKQNKRHLCL